MDEDVLETAKKLAARRGTTAGRVISDFVWNALAPRDQSTKKRHGVPVLPVCKRAGLVTREIVNQLRDEA